MARVDDEGRGGRSARVRDRLSAQGNRVAGTTGQELNDAKNRAQEKSKAQPTQPGDQGTPAQPPSQDKQQQLDSKTKNNQQQRAQGQGDQNSAGGSRPQVARPW